MVMLSFYSLLEQMSLIAQIDTTAYETSLKTRIEELIDFMLDEKERLKTFRFSRDYIQNILTKLQYPDIRSFMMAIDSKNARLINYHCHRASRWYIAQNFTYEDRKNNPAINSFYDALRHVYDYVDILNPHKINEQEYEQEYKRLVEQTRKNMQLIAKIVSEAANRIENWNGSSLKVIADSVGKHDEYLQPVRSAEVRVRDDEMASLGVYLEDNKVIVNEVVEPAEEFESNEGKMDYFNLVKELENPGSTSRGKIMTLYTARPHQDRARYLGARTIPANIYLTDKLTAAEDFAREWKGKDIWKIRINSRYVLYKGDLGYGAKEYHTIGPYEVPIESITLLQTFEEQS